MSKLPDLQPGQVWIARNGTEVTISNEWSSLNSGYKGFFTSVDELEDWYWYGGIIEDNCYRVLEWETHNLDLMRLKDNPLPESVMESLQQAADGKLEEFDVDQEIKEFGITDKVNKFASEKKVRPELIDPLFIKELASALAFGATKYAEDSYKDVFAVQEDDYARKRIGSLYRHILAYQEGETTDSETGESHLINAAVNLMLLRWYERKQEKGND